MLKKFNLFCENNKIDWILDKINKYGEDSLSQSEKDILKNKNIDKNINPKYNQYITKLLYDYKNGDISEEIVKKFVNKYINKEDLIEMILQLLNDNKLDHLFIDKI